MGLLIRPVEARDRAAMHDVLVVCGDFTDEEIRGALETSPRLEYDHPREV